MFLHVTYYVHDLTEQRKCAWVLWW